MLVLRGPVEAFMDWWRKPRWSNTGRLTKTKLPQLASLVPLLGYAVLYGDALQDVLMRYAVLGDGFLSPLTRVRLLYFGGVSTLLGLIAYWLWCPYPVKQYASRRDYISDAAESQDRNEFLHAGVALRASTSPNVQPLFGKYAITADDMRLAGVHTITSVLSAYYELMDLERPLRARASELLMYLGGGLFLIPSAEVLFLALRSFF